MSNYNFEFVTPTGDEEGINILKEEIEIIDVNEPQIMHVNSSKLMFEIVKCGEIIVVENRFFLTCNCNQNFKSLHDFSEHYLNKHTTTKFSQDNIDLLIESNSVDTFVPNIEEDTNVNHELVNNNQQSRNIKEETEFKKEVESQDENKTYNSPRKKYKKSIKSYNNKPSNEETKLKNTKIKSSVCEICGKYLPNKSTMMRHQRTHTGERPFKCRHCQKGFNYKNHCKRHELLHVKGKIYECDYCYLKFSRTDQKKVHEASHTTEDKKKVVKLGKKLAGLTSIVVENSTDINESESTVKQNLVQLDDSVPDGYWRCKICEKILKTSYKPEDHHRLHTGERPFICDICGKGMFSQSNLLRHVATHTQNRRYRCTICPAAYYCSTHLKRHEISHSSEKQFKCDMCNMKFWRKEHLTAHQVRHLANRQRNHKCDICEKTYLDVNALRHHKKKHTSGNDSFMCSTCPAVFQLKEALKRHEKRHLNKGMYKCDFCPDKRFNDKDDKNQHEKRCH